jgi:ABC-type branched-subunit amino acid transport system substrate-binding protein
VVREDAPLWGSAANIMVDLAFTEGVLAVIGSVDGTATHVALRVGLKAEVMMVNTASSDQTMTETNIPWLIRVFPDDRQHGYRLATMVVKERGSRRIAVLRSNDRYARMGIRLFNDSARRLGVSSSGARRRMPGAPRRRCERPGSTHRSSAPIASSTRSTWRRPARPPRGRRSPSR